MTVAISLVSQKGGVGKTTLALNLSLSFAQSGHRVLLVDTDPQGGIGASLAGDQDVVGLSGYVAGSPLPACLLKTRLPGFSLLPVGPLRGLERAALSGKLEDGAHLERLLQEAADFELVLFDTPAGLLASTLGALRASDLAYTALQAEPLAASSLPQLLEVIADLRDEGARVRFAGAILTMVQRDVEASMNVMESLWDKLPPDLVLDAHIPRDAVFLEASELGAPLAFMSQRPPPVARRFDELADEIAKHLPQDDKGATDAPIALLF